LSLFPLPKCPPLKISHIFLDLIKNLLHFFKSLSWDQYFSKKVIVWPKTHWSNLIFIFYGILKTSSIFFVPSHKIFKFLVNSPKNLKEREKTRSEKSLFHFLSTSWRGNNNVQCLPKLITFPLFSSSSSSCGAKGKSIGHFHLSRPSDKFTGEITRHEYAMNR
jgi:hypothetical protein